MADRSFQKKKRNVASRQRKPVMLITAEGNNKTEQLYFTSFQSQYGKYSVETIECVGMQLVVEPDSGFMR